MGVKFTIFDNINIGVEGQYKDKVSVGGLITRIGKTDKAKPRAIVGQKAMSSFGRAGLPKQEEFCRYVIFKRG
jgi:hypothetical protein